MSEARKLEDLTTATTAVGASRVAADTPPVRGPLDPSLDLDEASGGVDLAPVREAAGQSASTLDAAPRIAELAEETTVRPRRREHGEGRASGTLLVLFVVGLLAFLTGVALASAVLLGMLDAGWVKDALRSAKETLQQLKGP